MAIFVVLATIAGVVIVALTTSSGDSFEDAGRSDIGDAGTSSGFAEGSRRPNEIRDPALESMGLRGEIQDLPPALQGHWHGKQSETIGYRPYCPPWEYLTKGPNEKGEYEYDPTAAGNANIGGPNGAGGVYSSNTGCFAPCYWSFTAAGARVNGRSRMNSGSSLFYFDDNRAPVQSQVRLGVIYRRISETEWNARSSRPQQNYINYGTDVERASWFNPWDGKLNIGTWSGRSASKGPGLPWLASLYQPEPEVPTIYIPNFLAQTGASPDPGGIARNDDPNWEDENWEYRADPINRTCTIVNVTLDDQIVCSSEWENCSGPS